MRAKKPTMAGLQRELATLKIREADARRDAQTANREYDRAMDRCGDLQSQLTKTDRQVGWYEREREQTQCWFQESLRLVAPHLAPNVHTNSIDLAGNDPTERLLIEMRQRLSRSYSEYGHTLHRTMDTPF